MKNYSILYFLGLIFFIQPVSAVKMNPDISVNLLLLGKKTISEDTHKDSENKHKKHEDGHEKYEDGHDNHEDGHEEHSHFVDGFSVQEVELYFKSNIDPYWSGQISLGIFPHQGNFEINLEEAYIESLFIPSVTLKAGSFYAFLGRHNNLHTHHYPFIDPPLVNQEIFGFHGWSGSGVSMAYLAPLSWYSEIAIQGFYTNTEENSFAGLLFFKNFWELKSDLTFELDASYGLGVQDFDHLFNLAGVLKWQSLESAKQKSLFWTSEWMKGVSDHSSNIEGFSSYIQWQFLKNYWLGGRADYLSHNNWSDIEKQKYSVLLSFAPTEYSAIRLQYNTQRIENGHWSHGIAVQSTVSLGVHPAHSY